MPSYVLQYLKRTSNTVAAVFYTPRWRQKHHCKQWKSNPREGLAIFLTSGTFDNTWNIDLDPRINHMRPTVSFTRFQLLSFETLELSLFMRQWLSLSLVHYCQTEYITTFACLALQDWCVYTRVFGTTLDSTQNDSPKNGNVLSLLI